jgi:hypothetical protein
MLLSCFQKTETVQQIPGITNLKVFTYKPCALFEFFEPVLTCFNFILLFLQEFVQQKPGITNLTRPFLEFFITLLPSNLC